MIALPGRQGQLVLDVFDGGQPIDARALRALIKRVEGPKAELRPGLLQPMAARAVLLRLQNNIKSRRLDAGDLAGAAGARWRTCCGSRRTRGAVAGGGADQPAAGPCRRGAALLRPVPDAGAGGRGADRARTAMDELRTRLN